MVRRWSGGMGSVGQACGVQRRAEGDTGERGLDPEDLELDLPREVGVGCSAKSNVV